MKGGSLAAFMAPMAPQGLRPNMSRFLQYFFSPRSGSNIPRHQNEWFKTWKTNQFVVSIGKDTKNFDTPLEFHIFSGPISAMGQRTHGRSYRHGCFILSLADAWQRPKFGSAHITAWTPNCPIYGSFYWENEVWNDEIFGCSLSRQMRSFSVAFWGIVMKDWERHTQTHKSTVLIAMLCHATE